MDPDVVDFSSLVGPTLAGALEKRGFTELMPVQRAVLDPALAGRDLRISSQTGSGKTVAIGLSLRDVVLGPVAAPSGVARPRALVVVPTRELAKQVHDELTWLYTPHARVASATGGSDAREERRAFAAGPAVVVGTPGRLLDHLNRGSIDAAEVGVVVLDEADQMLDLGFREDLLAILKHTPPERRTHLVSATFPREVTALADRVQQQPARIEGTPLGTANADIDHVMHLVANQDRLGAIVNLLLATPGGHVLVFARTRADVAELTSLLSKEGFQVRALSGEMEQRERNQALEAFKRGSLDALIATDVAARGIDVQDIARVIHAEPPTDPDSYTHRSGRTGRAGRKGISSLLVAPQGLMRTSSLLRRAGVSARVEPIPSAKEIRNAIDDRLLTALTTDTPASEGDEARPEPDARTVAVAERIAASGDVVRAIARLLARTRYRGPEPHEVRAIEPPRAIDRPARQEPRMPTRERSDGVGDRRRTTVAEGRGSSDRAPSGREAGRDKGIDWVTFRVSWGSERAADPRRLLAMACRRGGVGARDVGAIVVGRKHSTVQIAAPVAEAFARAAGEPDPRDPWVTIRPEGAPPPRDREPRAAERRSEERPSRARVEERPSRARVGERPSRARVGERPSRAGEGVGERPSRAGVGERPSASRGAERPSKAHLGGGAPLTKKKRP